MSVVFEGVSVRYPGRDGAAPTHALDAVDLTLAGGEFTVLIGASGCGKTTLLNLAAGFVRPTAGRVLHRGSEVTGPGAERGVVFQQNALLPWLNVIDNVALGLRLAGVGKAKRHAIAARHIESVGLTEFRSHPVYQLSGGMQQRVGIARALAAEPAVLLMDEPLGALDAFTRESVQELLLRLWERSSQLVLFVTHSIEEALFLGTRLVVMTPRPGRILQIHEPRFCRRFLDGEPVRSIKSDRGFIELREDVLSLIRPDAADA